MKSLILAATALTLVATLAPPAQASAVADGLWSIDQMGDSVVDRRGRRKKRIPGGSGCDDPGDILEHPECAG
jgi:hypothetical protein